MLLKRREEPCSPANFGRNVRQILSSVNGSCRAARLLSTFPSEATKPEVPRHMVHA